MFIVGGIFFAEEAAPLTEDVGVEDLPCISDGGLAWVPWPEVDFGFCDWVWGCASFPGPFVVVDGDDACACTCACSFGAGGGFEWPLECLGEEADGEGLGLGLEGGGGGDLMGALALASASALVESGSSGG